MNDDNAARDHDPYQNVAGITHQSGRSFKAAARPRSGFLHRLAVMASMPEAKIFGVVAVVAGIAATLYSADAFKGDPMEKLFYGRTYIAVNSFGTAATRSFRPDGTYEENEDRNPTRTYSGTWRIEGDKVLVSYTGIKNGGMFIMPGNERKLDYTATFKAITDEDQNLLRIEPYTPDAKDADYAVHAGLVIGGDLDKEGNTAEMRRFFSGKSVHLQGEKERDYRRYYLNEKGIFEGIQSAHRDDGRNDQRGVGNSNWYAAPGRLCFATVTHAECFKMKPTMEKQVVQHIPHSAEDPVKQFTATAFEGKRTS